MFAVQEDTLFDQNHLAKVAEFAKVMLNYHFPDSGKHAEHVRLYTRLLLVNYNNMYPTRAVGSEAMQMICLAASLHDIGMIGIPDVLLKKKGPLTEEDRQQFRNHAKMGAEIVDRMAEINKLTKQECAILHNVCLYHHERYDGSGYPEGLKGDEIPLEAVAVSLAEVYDALTSENYTAARGHDEAMRTILSGECGAFDPDWLKCMEKCSRDLQLLLECGSNEERRLLLESTFGQSKKGYWVKKRLIDLALCIPAAIVLSPFCLIISAVIWIDDPHGSPIFKQTRIGRHKKEFTMYKFRSMYVNAEERRQELEAMNEKNGPVFKIKGDPRITRVGRFLRKTSIDELPQLINVIKGDMTLVGPRPPLRSEVEQYSRYTEMRLSVTPGLTCIWQVQPKRDDISFEDWMDMDIAYIGTRSVREDMKLLLLTVLSVFRRDGE